MSAETHPAQSAHPIPATAEARAEKVRAMAPADLVAGPCALPDAPLAMPEQVIEPARSLMSRLIERTRSRARMFPPPAAPTAGSGA